MKNLVTLCAAMKARGVTRLYAKVLAANDNSKNQVVLGSDIGLFNRFPADEVKADKVRSQSEKKGAPEQYIFKASVRFSWLLEDASISEAPSAQLILYPQYPEIRFSGFLKNCRGAPSTLMAGRQPGRVLFFGVTDSRTIIGYVVAPDSPVATEVRDLRDPSRHGVLIDIPVDTVDSRTRLLCELRRIASLGWITSKRLVPGGAFAPCLSPNCGGYTLEAELGICPNGSAEPDFYGWEIKQHAVTDFSRINGGVLTLMTPEPTGGFYREHGAAAFVRKFGYPDKLGRPGRLNFGGLHRFHQRTASTGCTLRLTGFDHENGKITDSRGYLMLESDDGLPAAIWSFEGLMNHWQRKHAQAAYVPSRKRDAPKLQYEFGSIIRLGEGTDFVRFLRAVASGNVYYDPGIKLESSDGVPRVKRRSQFRVKSRDLAAMYQSMEVVSL
jgi:hypothetical protein